MNNLDDDEWAVLAAARRGLSPNQEDESRVHQGLCGVLGGAALGGGTGVGGASVSASGAGGAGGASVSGAGVGGIAAPGTLSTSAVASGSYAGAKLSIFGVSLGKFVAAGLLGSATLGGGYMALSPHKGAEGSRLVETESSPSKRPNPRGLVTTPPVVTPIGGVEAKPNRPLLKIEDSRHLLAEKPRTPPIPKKIRSHAIAASPKSNERSEKNSSLSRELSQLVRARRTLARGDASLTLSILHDLDKKSRSSAFVEERSASRILALCMTGKVDAAKKEARTFSARWPHSVYGDRLTQSCVGGASSSLVFPNISDE